VGGHDSFQPLWVGGGAAADDDGDDGVAQLNPLAEDFDAFFRAHWWGAVATVTRLVGDLEVAEDAVQEACAAALAQWPQTGLPANPRAWIVGVARHKALDRLRREARRPQTEEQAVRQMGDQTGDQTARGGAHGIVDDELRLIFMCCHPALDMQVRVPLTLRSVCGLTTAEIAAAFLVPEATMAQRIVRAKRKIRQAGIPFLVPTSEALPQRLAAVLRVVYLVFTEGHRASSGLSVVRDDLCDEAVRLARALSSLLPAEPEVTGLLALFLLTDARRAARVDNAGEMVLLADQDRTLWDRTRIDEGVALVERSLRQRRPGPYQLQAAIAACHSQARSADATDWREIAALYGELTRHEPTPIVEANRAVAVAMAEGPAAGLFILDTLAAAPQMARWSQLHIARAGLLSRLGRYQQAIEAYQTAMRLEPSATTRAFIAKRIVELVAGD
jgi:RNA polymerase sigma-70 factor, ECF subfamily